MSGLARCGSWSLEAWPLGWVVCSGECSPTVGVPLDALSQAMNMMAGIYGKKEAGRMVMAVGVGNFVKKRCNRRAVFVICTPENETKWRAQIEAHLATAEREERWFYGTDTGLSSQVIFATLGSDSFAPVRHARIELEGRCPRPQDAADFGRCRRLLDLFPEWRERLHEVAEKHPEWKGLVAHWRELEVLHGTSAFQSRFDEVKGGAL